MLTEYVAHVYGDLAFSCGWRVHVHHPVLLQTVKLYRRLTAAVAGQYWMVQLAVCTFRAICAQVRMPETQTSGVLSICPWAHTAINVYTDKCIFWPCPAAPAFSLS